MIVYVCYFCLIDELIFVEAPNLKGDSTQKFFDRLECCLNEIVVVMK